MASLSETSLQKRLEKRKGTMSEVDRVQYEKQQVSIKFQLCLFYFILFPNTILIILMDNQT